MQISSRFTMAIHMFACIDVFKDMNESRDHKETFATAQSSRPG